MDVSLSELAASVGGKVVGDGSRRLTGVATLEDAGPDQISFFANTKYKARYLATRAGAVIVSAKVAEGDKPGGASLLVAEAEPYLAFAKVSTLFQRKPAIPVGVDPRAAVDPSASVDPTASVMPFAYVGPGVQIGARTVIHAHCAILEDAVIGADCLLYPGVVIREGCSVGDRVIVQPGAVIGADGFGFAFDPAARRHLKVPQVGRVELQPDVEIGANTCVDRGTLGDTSIGMGSKIDNLVQIGHNVQTGPLCLIAGQTGIAGSTHLGTGVVMGGQSGVIGHLEVGSGAMLAARTLVMGDVPAGGAWGGSPAGEQRRWLREQAASRQLPELLKEMRALRKRVAELEKP